MRPSPADVITGVRRILKDVVGPEVASEYARSRLAEVRAVLAQVDWNDAALRLRQDVLVQRQLLAEIDRWRSASLDRVEHFAAVAPANICTELPATYDELDEVYRSEAASLVELNRSLAIWTRAHPHDVSARDLRTTILAALAGAPAPR